MKRIILLCFLALPLLVSAQIETSTLYDFETTAPDSFSTFGAVDTTLLASQFTIANPAPDAVNGSANVMRYTKGADAQTWAGYFWDMDAAIDANSVFEVCLDYWSPSTGQILIKLENGDASQDWELAANNSTPGQWETLCVDLRNDSQGANPGPASGRSFTRFVLFPEFNVAGIGSDVDYFIDNITITSDNTVREFPVTFSVDMNDYPEPFTTVFVSGTFNDWSGEASPLEDADGDGVWTGTYDVTQGEIEYKFTIDNWADQENFSRFDECITATTDSNGETFVNRSLVVFDEVVADPVCWSTCYACGESYSITWNVNMATADPADTGVFVAGGCCFSNSIFELTDPDGDGIFSLSMTRGAGFNSFYTLINGACPDFSCKENIEGQECADPNNFNDRFLPPLEGDVVINTCFGQCTSVAECEVIPEVEVTFFVDLVGETIDPEGVRIAGNFTNWQDEDMILESGTVYRYTTVLPAGEYEYQFKNGPNGWEVLPDGEDCTITTDDGQGNVFINRALSLSGASSTESTRLFCFNTCNSCAVATDDLEIDNTIMELRPSVTAEYFDVILNEAVSGQLSILSTSGELMFTKNITTSANVLRVDATSFSAGMYFVNLQTENNLATQRVVITK